MQLTVNSLNLFFYDFAFNGFPLKIITMQVVVLEELDKYKLLIGGLHERLRMAKGYSQTALADIAGVSLPAIMDRLGHVDDETTTRVYLHVTKVKKLEASQKFSELMKNL